MKYPIKINCLLYFSEASTLYSVACNHLCIYFAILRLLRETELYGRLSMLKNLEKYIDVVLIFTFGMV